MSKYQSLVLADGAIHYWPLDDAVGSTTANDAGGAATTVNGGVTFGVPGPGTDKAAQFGGMDAWADNLMTDAPVLIPKVVTFEAWIKTPPEATQDQLIFSNRTGGPSDPVAVMGYGGQQVAMAGSGGGTVMGATRLNDDVWHHVVAVFDAQQVLDPVSQIWLYVDGVLDATGLLTRNAASTGGIVTIGGNDDLTYGWWLGQLAHVALYPRVLSFAEILNHYNTCLKADVPSDGMLYLELALYDVYTVGIEPRPIFGAQGVQYLQGQQYPFTPPEADAKLRETDCGRPIWRLYGAKRRRQNPTVIEF